jgi:16S rRNA processing protein RimM
MLDKYITIGYTKKSYGSKGQVKAVVQNQFLEDFVQSEFVFINQMGKPVPFFIESIEEMGDLLLKVEEIDSPEQAKAIISKDLFLREKDLSNPPIDIPDSDLEFGDLIGFILADVEVGDIGGIKEIQEFPQQEMAVVEYNGKDIFIPLHAKLVAAFDEKGKKITLKLPEGLLEL